MALTDCPECGSEVSTEAKECPNCGFPIQNKVNEEDESGHSSTGKGCMKWGCVAPVVILLALGIGGAVIQGTKKLTNEVSKFFQKEDQSSISRSSKENVCERIREEESIKEIQRLLNEKGHNLKVDGIWGPNTKSELEAECSEKIAQQVDKRNKTLSEKLQSFPEGEELGSRKRLQFLIDNNVEDHRLYLSWENAPLNNGTPRIMASPGQYIFTLVGPSKAVRRATLTWTHGPNEGSNEKERANEIYMAFINAILYKEDNSLRKKVAKIIQITDSNTDSREEIGGYLIRKKVNRIGGNYQTTISIEKQESASINTEIQVDPAESVETPTNSSQLLLESVEEIFASHIGDYEIKKRWKKDRSDYQDFQLNYSHQGIIESWEANYSGPTPMDGDRAINSNALYVSILKFKSDDFAKKRLDELKTNGNVSHEQVTGQKVLVVTDTSSGGRNRSVDVWVAKQLGEYVLEIDHPKTATNTSLSLSEEKQKALEAFVAVYENVKR